MATKLKKIMPPVIPISQRSPFSGEKGDGQQLIRRKVKSPSSRRPKLSVRSKKQFSSSKTKNLKKRQKIQSENPSTGNQEQAAWDSISPLDPMNCENRKFEQKATKKRISFKIVKRAGKRIEWLLKKGAKYFGYAIIKVFNQPGIYTDESRTCVC